jgi:RsmE family RNA methyltransferase
MNLSLLFREDYKRDDRLVTISGHSAFRISEDLQLPERKFELGMVRRFGVSGGEIFQARVISIGREIRLQIESFEVLPEVQKLELLLAIPRPQMLGRILEFVAAFRIEKVSLVETEKTQRGYVTSPVIKEYKKFLYKGMEQGVSTYLPQVDFFSSLSSFIESREGKLSGWVAHTHTTSIDHQFSKDISSILAIGPEAGWSEEEFSLLQIVGLKPLSFGDCQLRVDQSVIFGCGMLVR